MKAMSMVFLCLLSLISACTSFPAWRDQAIHDVAEGRWHVDPAYISPGGSPSQTTEFYSPSGQHLGYGRIQGGTMEFYNVDGSRAGYGRSGR